MSSPLRGSAVAVVFLALGCAAGPGTQDSGTQVPVDAGTGLNEPGPPTVLRVTGNVDAGAISSFTRVSFVLEDGAYTYFRVGDGDTFVSAVTAKYVVGRFVNQSGDVDSFVLDLATNQSQVFRLPDLTEVWLVDANERGTMVGTAKRAGSPLPDGGETSTTIAFRHDLKTARTTELNVEGNGFYLDLLEDDTALALQLTPDDGGVLTFIERSDGGRVEIRKEGSALEYQYYGLLPGDRLIGLRSSDTRGAVISTLENGGLTHRFFDVPRPDGGVYPTSIFEPDENGLAVIRYDAPVTAGGMEFNVPRYFLQGIGPSMAPRTEFPPAASIFLDPTLAEVSYSGVRWGRVWGVATYYGP